MDIRRLLHAAGLRFRVDVRPIVASRRRADIVFRPLKLAVFVDGCFWHLCPRHCVFPKANAAWWRDKLLENARRDRETTAELRAAGWRVVRAWEHEPPERVAERVVTICQRLRARAKALLAQQMRSGGLSKRLRRAAGPSKSSA